MTSHIKELVLLSLLNIAAAVSKVSSSLKTTRHEAFNFWYHINKIHTQINQIAVTAKTLSQPGIQLCVASVAVQSGKQTSMGCMRDFPGLFNIHVSSEHRSYCDSPEIRKYSSYIMVQWTSHPASKCVFSNSSHCPLSACSPTMWL